MMLEKWYIVLHSYNPSLQKNKSNTMAEAKWYIFGIEGKKMVNSSSGGKKMVKNMIRHGVHSQRPKMKIFSNCRYFYLGN